MISLRRPDDARVTSYRRERLDVAPTVDHENAPGPAFRRDVFQTSLGTGTEVFDRARLGLGQWAAHVGAGVEVSPADASIQTGQTVALVTRQLGLWVLAGCRIVAVVDEPMTYGFTYATLPDHPECGYESFTVQHEDGEVTFHVEAVSHPATAITRFGAPIARELQRRATNRYLSALERWTYTDD